MRGYLITNFLSSELCTDCNAAKIFWTYLLWMMVFNILIRSKKDMDQLITLIAIIFIVYNIIKWKNAKKRELAEARGELISDVLNEIERNAKDWYCIGVGLEHIYCDYPSGSYKYPSQKFASGRNSNKVVMIDRNGWIIHVYDFDEHNYVVGYEAKEAIANAIAKRFGGKVIRYTTMDHDHYSSAGVLDGGSMGANGFKVFSNQLLLDEKAIVDRENAKRRV